MRLKIKKWLKSLFEPWFDPDEVLRQVNKCHNQYWQITSRGMPPVDSADLPCGWYYYRQVPEGGECDARDQ